MFPLFTAHKDYLTACRRGLHVNVRLGSPRRRDCHGTGICKMQTATTLFNDSCSCWVSAFVRIDRPTGRLLLHVDNDAISERIRRRHFAGDCFSVDTAFSIPHDLTDLLGLAEGTHRIAPGHYPTLDDGVYTTISLRVAEGNIVRLPGVRRAA